MPTKNLLQVDRCTIKRIGLLLAFALFFPLPLRRIRILTSITEMPLLK